ncbi:hypothetical protein [Lentzea aerocolonigenes]|uniref:hypothetical protein n=1 Tax=Lentzea aerocolonigenes TaxID=68170 RepID=UPI0006982A2C|nr:hypothetical protein [Lentzea aerocolonigenes]
MPPPRKSRTGLFVGLAVVLVLLLAGGGTGAFLLLNRDSSSTPEAPSTSSEATAAAPALLQQQPGEGPPRKYGDTAVYDACSLLTMADLTNLGITLTDQFPVGHDYVDIDVPADKALPQGTLDPLTHCYYSMKSLEWVQVFVYQPPFTAQKDMESRKGKPERGGHTVHQADGFSVANYQDHKNNTWDISLWQQDLIVEVSFQTEKKQPYGSLDAKAFADKLESLVKAAIQKGPTAPMLHIYPEPFAGKFKDPCDVASADAYRKSYPNAGLPALVKTQFHVFASDTPMERHPESALQGGALCQRYNIAPEASLDVANYRVLEASLRMWDKPQAAIDRNAYQCDPADKHPFGPPVAITPSLGTGQACMTNLQIDWVLDFQLGEVNVSVQGDHGGPASYTLPPVEGLRDELLPAARHIAEQGVQK